MFGKTGIFTVTLARACCAYKNTFGFHSLGVWDAHTREHGPEQKAVLLTVGHVAWCPWSLTPVLVPTRDTGWQEKTCFPATPLRGARRLPNNEWGLLRGKSTSDGASCQTLTVNSSPFLITQRILMATMSTRQGSISSIQNDNRERERSGPRFTDQEAVKIISGLIFLVCFP